MPDSLLVPTHRMSSRRRAIAPFHVRTAHAGGPVAYADFGGEGPPIVLVHGLGGCHLNWLPAAPMLARHARVLAVDLVGFGRTPRAGRPHGLEGQRAMLQRFLGEVVREPAVLAGNSMGGLLGLMHAARAPEQVAGLCLVSPALPPARGKGPEMTSMARYLVQATPGLGEVVMWAQGRRLGARGMFMDLLTLGTKDVRTVPADVVEANIALIAERMLDSPLGHAQSYLDATRSMAAHLLIPGLVDSWARKVRSPTLLLHGVYDRIVPKESSEELAARHGFEMDLLDTAGHVPQMEDAPRFVERVVGWMHRHSLLAAPRTVRSTPPHDARDEAPASRAA